MDEREIADNSGAVEQSAAVAEQAPAVSCARPKAAVRHRRVVPSIKARTLINYVLFSAIILLLLWAVFFFGLYSIYGNMLERDMDYVGQSAMAAFPRRGDDNSINMQYRLRLGEIARTNAVEIILFSIDDDGKYNIRIVSDALDDEPDSYGHYYKAVMSSVDFDALFASGGAVSTVDTDYGDFLYYGNSQKTEISGGGAQTLYLLVIKPYAVFNSHTVKILYTLIICTVIVLVLSSVFAYFAAHYQTKRLTDFTSKAKLIADGDYGVEFEGYGYDEYEILAGALNAATNRMQSAEQLQRDIIANVSHDIRTPLTMIKAYAEMLRDMPVDEQKRKRTSGVIISEADRLTSLVDDVLSYSRLQAGVTEFKPERCDISAVAQTVLSSYDIYRERDGMTVESDIDKNAFINCDVQRIEQVLYNFVNNAINYCGEDKTVIVRVKKAGECVRVEISDHGRGIAPDELDAVWDRYYRTAHSKRTTVGSGLGLSICKNILSAHGAEYGVQSAIGEGTTFWFEFAAVK